ncbi:MAG: DNA polymerase III subunit delta, partial [Verrucomicrobiota bacterium]
ADNAEGAWEISTRVIEGLQTLGFFGGEKVVWLKGASFFGDDRTGNAERATAGVENLLECLKGGVPGEVEVLISARGVDKRRAFYKWMAKNAEVLVFDKIDVSKEGWEDEVAVMVVRRAKELGMSFREEALDLFVQLAGEDTRQVGSELEKLALYLGEGAEVDLESVRLLVPATRKGVIWEISRAIESGRAARAVELIDALLEKGESAIGLMRAAIIPTVRNLFYAGLALEQRVPTGNYRAFQGGLEGLPPEVRAIFPKKKDGGVNAWGLFAAAGKVGRKSMGQLRQGLEDCLEADKALVTTGLDHRLVLHRLVVKLAG